MTAYNDEELFEEDGTIKSCNLIIPKCDSLDYNYYVYKGSILSDLSSNTLSNDIVKAVKRGEEYFHIFVNPDSLNFDSVYDKLFSDESYDFASYIREANAILGREALSTSVVVTAKKQLSVISVQLNYK